MPSLDAGELVRRAQNARRAGGDPSQALADLKAAVNQLSDRGGPDLAFALKWLGQIERDLGHNAEAASAYEASTQAYRQAGETNALAHTQRHLADVLMDCGDLARADAAIDEALAIYETSPPEPLELANTWRIRAILTERLGDREAARRAWMETRSRYQATAVRPGVAEADSHLAGLR